MNPVYRISNFFEAIPYVHTWPGQVKTKHKGRHGRFEQRKIAAQKRHAKSRKKR